MYACLTVPQLQQGNVGVALQEGLELQPNAGAWVVPHLIVSAVSACCKGQQLVP